MKNKFVRVFLAAFIVMMSLACSVFTRLTRTEATPTSDYIFTPSTVRLQFAPDSLPNAQTGVEYEAEIRVSDYVTPVDTIFVSSGTLPAGLELVFVDGEDGAKISGIPEEAGTFTFTIYVGCKGTMVPGQNAEKEYVIVVE